MKITKTIFVDAETDDDPDEQEVEFPSRFEVCSRCEGKGSHVNPSIDGHGISQDEWEHEWGEEERENYFSGVYDVVCSDCKGNRVVAVIDESALTDDQRANYETWCDQEENRASDDRAEAAIRRMENGGYG